MFQFKCGAPEQVCITIEGNGMVSPKCLLTSMKNCEILNSFGLVSSSVSEDGLVSDIWYTVGPVLLAGRSH